MSRPLLSVIIPAYKQQRTITKDLSRIRNVLGRIRYRSEIICVVDGRIDKTFEKAQKYAGRYRRIKVVGYETNRGKGYAVRYGIARSSGEIIAFIDAGMDLNPNGLSMILEHFEWYNADIIVGSKRHQASRVVYPWQRKILSIGYQYLVWILFGLRIKDTQVGLKLFRREVLEKVLPRLLVKAFAFDIEMLAVANYLGFKRIFEAPVDINLRFGGTSTLTSRGFLKTALRMMMDTLAVFYRLKVVNYYSGKNHRRWRYEPELRFRVNIG